MSRAATFVALALLVFGGVAMAQQGFRPWTQPDGQPITGQVLNCETGSDRQAVPCGVNAAPLRVSPAPGAATQPVSGTVAVSNQPSALALTPNRGVAAACAGAGSIGTTAALICPAGSSRSYIALQNQSDTATIYCNLMGGTATLGPPSRKLLPNASLVQGASGGGFVTTAAINCVASAAGASLSAEVLQ